MNQKQRQEYIAEMLKIKGSITTNELVEELSVSKMTIGRDLKELESVGIAELFHGGAMYQGANILEYPITVKQDLFVNEKQKIAKKAVEHIADGSSIFIETGTTTLHVALELLNKKSCLFYTNSLSVVNHLSKIDDLTIHMAPGKYRKMSDGFMGLETIAYVENLYFDYCFLGTEGVSQDGWVSVHSSEDALTKRAILAQSKQKILVFDRSKIGKKLLYKVGDIADFNKIVTDYDEMEQFITDKDISIPHIIISK
ncbi:DeoR/GlpR family DNA-binding transcription regulator [Vagococcus sp. JNUCC 83]